MKVRKHVIEVLPEVKQRFEKVIKGSGLKKKIAGSTMLNEACRQVEEGVLVLELPKTVLCARMKSSGD